MRIHFWGVRGSLPSPLLPAQIKSKISAVLERLTPADIESPEMRERFLAGLPPWLFGTVGGNSPCVSVRLDNSPAVIVFDAGSGLREMGIAARNSKNKAGRYHFFFSHFHWDHIQGLPFFGPAYDPGQNLDFYHPGDELETALRGQMNPPYFPVSLEAMGAKKTFHRMTGPVNFGDGVVSSKRLNHPGGSWSYQVNDGKHKFIYASDTELSPEDFIKTGENIEYFSNADVIVIDSQYTLGEAIEKYHWGHSAFSMALDFAALWGIKHIILFHHDPAYDDKKLFNIFQSARWYLDRMNIKGIKVSLAIEGMEIVL